jgi:hypothetical protein
MDSGELKIRDRERTISLSHLSNGTSDRKNAGRRSGDLNPGRCGCSDDEDQGYLYHSPGTISPHWYPTACPDHSPPVAWHDPDPRARSRVPRDAPVRLDRDTRDYARDHACNNRGAPYPDSRPGNECLFLGFRLRPCPMLPSDELHQQSPQGRLHPALHRRLRGSPSTSAPATVAAWMGCARSSRVRLPRITRAGSDRHTCHGDKEITRHGMTAPQERGD